MAETQSDRIELRSEDGTFEATFIPDAGMIGWSLRHRGEELLAHPRSLEDYVDGGHVTALPLLHPWANRLAGPDYEIAGRAVHLDMAAPNIHTDPGGLPIHGLVAGCPRWEVVDAGRGAGAEAGAEVGAARLRARLDFAARPELMSGFPFAHVLELTAELTRTGLTVTTALTPTGASAVPVAFGFHPYLHLPGIAREEWLLELPVTSRMILDDRMLPTGRSEPVQIAPGPLGDRTFDDAFDGLPDDPSFAVTGGGRRLALRFLEGYRFAQIYAPEGSDFICFEPMTAPVDPFAGGGRARLVEPGDTFIARFSITVTDAPMS